VGQEALPIHPVQKTGIDAKIIGKIRKPLIPALITIEEEFEPVEFTEKEYEEAVKRLKQDYPQIGRRVYKSRKKSWKQVFEEMFNIIKKEEEERTLKSKTNQ
jgi:hypothetical protein